MFVDLDAYKLLLNSIAEQSLKEDNYVVATGFVPSDMNPLLSDPSTFLKEDNPHPSLQLVFGVYSQLHSQIKESPSQSQSQLRRHMKIIVDKCTTSSSKLESCVG